MKAIKGWICPFRNILLNFGHILPSINILTHLNQLIITHLQKLQINAIISEVKTNMITESQQASMDLGQPWDRHHIRVIKTQIISAFHMGQLISGRTGQCHVDMWAPQGSKFFQDGYFIPEINLLQLHHWKQLNCIHASQANQQFCSYCSFTITMTSVHSSSCWS